MNDPSRCSPLLEISLDNIVHNLGEIRRVIPAGKGIMAVVKDLAYGCGSVPVSRILEANGVSFLAVAYADEARILRAQNIALPILVLGTCNSEDLAWGAANNISFSLNDLSDIAAWKSLDAAIRFHLNVDTGMGRLGVLPQQLGQIAEAIQRNKRLMCEGVYTHLASADVPATDTVERQLKLFSDAISFLRQAGVPFSHIHYANSAGLMRFPLSPDCTLVRPGITLYGCKPDPAQQFPLALKSAVTLKGPVIKVKHVPSGTPISYGGRYVTAAESHIATVALGYGIGLPRRLTGKGSVLIKGKRFAIAGTVTMDYIMVDVGTPPAASVGDEVVAIGYQGEGYISPDEVALQCQTIAYEILCHLSTRLERKYIYKNNVFHHMSGFFF